MSRVIVDLNFEELIRQLDMEQKIHLVRKLEDETLEQRMDILLKNIDGRSQNNPVSEKEIGEEIQKVRREIYDKSSN